MKIQDPNLTAANLAERIAGELLGDGSIVITGINEIHHVEAGDICFVDHPKYYDSTLASTASVILIDQAYDCPPGKALIVISEPFTAYNNLVAHYQSKTNKPFAVASEYSTCVNLKIGLRTRIAPGAQIGDYVTIGDDCIIEANAVIGDHTSIGNGVFVGANSVIGSRAFYFKRTADGYQPWDTGGRVILEDRVAIGPNCNIARGVSSDTVIGAGSKLDALVQIGHDCKIGPNCLFAAQVGVAGNTTIGEWSILQGQVGITQNLVIGPKTVVLAQSGIGKNLEGGKSYFGSPAQEARKAFKDLATLRMLNKKK
ncbi:MAG: UDP-3-O-(3-hydroxymyristoyl)glucosamine N-acyltransferase [Bacteroidota bacterium]